MSTSFKRLKTISVLTKNLINGYIRIQQRELSFDLMTDNPYYNIPQLVNNYCMLFYEEFRWYQQKHGRGVEFLSPTKIEINTDLREASTCLFENEISNELCDKFSFTFELMYGSNWDLFWFYIGYATGHSIEESITNWDQPLGEEHNDKTSWGWIISDDELWHSGDGHVMEDIAEEIDYSLGDLIKVSLNFKETTARIYHNEKELNCQDLTVGKLWVGVSFKMVTFYHKGGSVEMVDYKYD